MPRSSRLDRTAVLDAAMTLFWSNGYHATSLDDLVAVTGAARYGLYGMFGDKRGLYLAALAHYEQAIVNRLFSGVEARGAGPAQVRGYFESLIAMAASPQGRWGCLMAGAAQEMAGADPAVAAMTGAYQRRLRDGFTRAGADDPDGLVERIFGMQVLARAGAL